jgi:hypothetical protein
MIILHVARRNIYFINYFIQQDSLTLERALKDADAKAILKIQGRLAVGCTSRAHQTIFFWEDNVDVYNRGDHSFYTLANKSISPVRINRCRPVFDFVFKIKREEKIALYSGSIPSPRTKTFDPGASQS